MNTRSLFLTIGSLALLSACSQEQNEVSQKPEPTEVLPIISADHVVTSKEPSSFLSTAPIAQADEAGATYVSVYNSNLALVKETRELALNAGANEVRFSGVPDQIDTSSVKFKDLEHPSTSILEQNYRYDLVSQQALLKNYVDERVTVQVQDGDAMKEVTGTLLSYDDGVVLKTDRGVEAFTSIAGFRLPTEGDLITKPTLIWLLSTEAEGPRNTETSYLTAGMTWKADYVAVVNDDDTQLDLKGWTTIDNTSGKDFTNAQLQLIAGDVNRVQQPKAYARGIESMAMDTAFNTGGGGFQEESLFEYHLYTLGRKTNVLNKEQKQIELLATQGVQADKHFIYDSQKSHDKVRTILKLKNSEEKGLGMPLPAGVLRAFKADSSGQLQFIGEDRIDHTPEEKEFDVFLGNAFDLSAERNVQNNKQIPNLLGNSRGDSQDVEVILLNSKDEEVTITIVERVWGKNATVSGPNVEKIDANTFEIDVVVPGGGKEKSVTYTISRYY